MANGPCNAPQYDCLIIGGGPAGMSAARVLARQRYRVIVLDAGRCQHETLPETSSRSSRHSDHTLSYWKYLKDDSIAPCSGIQIEAATISSARALQNDHFEASDTAGRVWRGRTLLLAVGMRTVFPGLPGYQECWNGAM